MITKNKTVNQLTALKEWSQNPAAYQKKLADKKLIKWALEESPVPIVKNPVMKKAIAADPAAGAKYIDWWDRIETKNRT